MPQKLASVVFGAMLLIPVQASATQPPSDRPACPGIDLAVFEQRFPDHVQRFAFDRALLEPFVELWRSSRRPDLPIRPERVTIYALPDQPYLIGYQHGDCLIAFLTIERHRLWRWLRPRIGWTV